MDRPSVNVVVYEGGRERFYLLSELAADQCEWGADGRSWRLGGCSFEWVDEVCGGAGTTRTLQGVIDLALPTGGRVTGRLRLSGALRRDPTPGGQDGQGRHLWTPMLAASSARLELRTPGAEFRIDGRGYHDRNSAAEPLHCLGIQSWRWGRIALPGRDLIFYRLTPSEPGAAVRDLVVELAADGSSRVCEDAGLEMGRLRRSPWGLRWPSSVTFPDPDGRPVRVETSALLDSGPFYQRYLLRGSCGADHGYGIGEHLVPDRVDSDLLRPLVRMRVHRADGPNSMWLPLFSGDADGRLRRLFGGSGGVRV